MSRSKRKLYNSDKINNFRELVDRYQRLYASKTAFEYKQTPHSKEHIKITYQKFVKDIKALGTSLLNLGLRGKRVAIIAPNRYEWCTSYLAITTSDMVVVPLDKSLPNNELESLIRRSDVDAVIFDKSYTSTFHRIWRSIFRKSNSGICMEWNVWSAGAAALYARPGVI